MYIIQCSGETSSAKGSAAPSRLEENLKLPSVHCSGRKHELKLFFG